MFGNVRKVVVAGRALNRKIEVLRQKFHSMLLHREFPADSR